MKGKYFLAVSNKPFDNSTFDHKVDKYCMIYLKKDESVVFVKDKIIKPEDRNQEEFPRGKYELLNLNKIYSLNKIHKLILEKTKSTILYLWIERNQ